MRGIFAMGNGLTKKSQSMTNGEISKIISVSEGKIVLYSTPDNSVYVDVVFKDETFWMTQKVMAVLFDVNTPAISKHLKNIFEELVEIIFANFWSGR